MRTLLLSLCCLLMALVSLSCRGPEGPAGPTGPPGEGSASLSDPLIMPKVIYSFPEANSTGPYEDFLSPSYATYRLRFNKYMNLSSIRRSISLVTPSGAVMFDTNLVQTIGGDFFTIESGWTYPSLDVWQIGSQYHLRVDTGAMDINGNRLTTVFDLAFTPEPHFRILYSSPGEGEKISPMTRSFYIWFNTAVDTTVYSAIHFSPPIAGKWSLSPDDSMSVQFRTLDDFSRAQDYTFAVDPTAHDRLGHALPQAYIVHFSVIPFTVVWTYPDSTMRRVWMTSSIELTFSLPIDTSTLRKAFQFSPSLEYSGYWYPNSSGATVFPVWNFAPETDYTFTIGTAMHSYRGDSLTVPFVLRFTTGPFIVYNTYPNYGDRDVSTSTSVQINCSGKVDTATIRPALSVSDSSGAPVAGRIDASVQGASYFTFTPFTALKPTTRYYIAVTTALHAMGGYQLKESYFSTFRTGM